LNLTILKLGGSVITVKDKPLTPNLAVIKRLSVEISEANVSPLIIIHGGGSYGHPLAGSYKLHEGLKERTQLIGFSKTHQAMVSLNKLVVESLVEEDIPAFSISPSSIFVTKNGRIHTFNGYPLKFALEIGLVPVLYGDVTLDYARGVAVLSGDQIAGFLATELKAKRVVMAVDVDGVFMEDPKLNPSARLIPRLSLKQLDKFIEGIGNSRAPDVTGGMINKILELVSPIKHGATAYIVNALKPGLIRKVLKGEKCIGTEIRRV